MTKWIDTPSLCEGCSDLPLRDYFAIKIAAALMTGPYRGICPPIEAAEDWRQATAKTAYELADAMLEQRKTKP